MSPSSPAAGSDATEAPVHAIVGPTGSGKSALAMRWARAAARSGAPVEIVAIDAFTIYRGMDIGTAKPSSADRAEVRHHMIDVLDPHRDVTVAWFQAEARAAIAEVRDRGRRALLVGGSGLYFRAVVDDLRFPPTDEAVRADLEAQYRGRAREAHAEVARRDPAAAARIGPDNLRRSVRALEVMEVTGELFSAFRDAWDQYTSVYEDLAVTYLEPAADDLRAAIAQRAEAMVAEGLLDEVRSLQAAHAGGLSTTARQAIGYGEALEVLDGRAPREGLAERIAQRTWGYARRQRSWFRRDPRCAAG